MVRLSVNINKIATIRNARGGKTPDLIKMAQDIERFGAQGIKDAIFQLFIFFYFTRS